MIRRCACKAECRVHSSSDVFDTIGVSYWLVVNNDKRRVWWVLVCCDVVEGIVSVLSWLKASELAESHVLIDVMVEAMMVGDSAILAVHRCCIDLVLYLNHSTIKIYVHTPAIISCICR